MIGRATRVASLASTLAAGSKAGLADSDLLAAFLDRRDEAAFATLMRRHRPLVMSTCRHLLRDESAAEGALPRDQVARPGRRRRRASAAPSRRCGVALAWRVGLRGPGPRIGFHGPRPGPAKPD